MESSSPHSYANCHRSLTHYDKPAMKNCLSLTVVLSLDMVAASTFHSGLAHSLIMADVGSGCWVSALFSCQVLDNVTPGCIILADWLSEALPGVQCFVFTLENEDGKGVDESLD